MTNNKNNIFIFITKTIIAAMIVFVLFPAAYASDDISQDITSQITYKTNSSKWAGSIVDDNYMSYWYTSSPAYKYIQLESSEYIKYLYVCYIFKPSQLLIQTSKDGENWADIASETTDEFYHVTYTLDTPAKLIRIQATEDSTGKFGICEVKAYSEGSMPSDAQSWLPAYENPDMMIFSAHPDDEAVFFAGLIPYYPSAEGKEVQMVYMAVSKEYRHSEVLNYLWSMHQNHLPLYGNFTDVYDMDSYSYTRSIWGEQKTIDFMVQTIRERKPDVVVSHDINGEYGHGAHMFTALCLQQAVLLAADPEYHSDSYEKYGTHQVKKLYLHLYDENKIHLDILDTPLDEFGGLTAIEIAKKNISLYESQLMFEVVRVHDETSDFSCYEYGLAYTSVGDDVKLNDMFENILPPATPTPEPTSTPTASPTLSPTAAPSPATAPPAELPESENQHNVYINKTLIIIVIIFLAIVFSSIIAVRLYIDSKKK